MNQEEFSNQLQKAFKDALAQSDKIVADAKKIYKKAEKELDAAEEIRRKAEREGERMADEYYEGKREEFAEFYRTELLRNLARHHIEVGKTNHEISLWLLVEQRFVQNIRDVVERVEKYRGEKPKRTPLEGNPSITIGEDRDGRFLSFDSLEGKFETWIEFGVGTSIISDEPKVEHWEEDTYIPVGTSILIGVPNPEHWEEKTGIPFDRRERVLTYVAEYVIDEKMDGHGSFLVGTDVVSVFRE